MVKRIALFLSILSFLSCAVYADTDELNYINAAIHGKGHKWIAGETSVSKLSHEERHMRVRLEKPFSADGPILAATESQVTIATSLDWRSYNGNSYVTPVRDQGGCGSCWAFATAAALESSTNIKQNTPGFDLNVAEQILVSCSGAGSCDGGTVSGASNFIRDTGLPGETAYRYTATNGTCSNATPNWQLSDYRIISWSYVATSSPTVDGIKNALNTHGPLVTTMAVWNDFFSYRGGIYAYATGTLAGYHAIQIVGYDDVNQCFVCKNSWGTGWGEAGFFRIAYSELNSVTQFGDYTIAYVNSTPTPPPPEPPPPPVCSYSITPASASFSYGKGTGSITITASASTCTWTAAPSPGWVTITSASSGTGNGTVRYSVTANTSTSARSGSITLADKTLSISQKAAPAPKRARR